MRRLRPGVRIGMGAGAVLPILSLVFGRPAPGGAESPATARRGIEIRPVAFDREVRPILAKYCLECHGGGRKIEGKLNLKAFRDETTALRAPKILKKIHDMVHAREMPPEDAPQPAFAERDLITDWVRQALRQSASAGPADPGRVVLRRLNRVEYRNTVGDLIGVDYDGVRDFPSDEVGYGFDNIGDVLSLPPLLMEKYLEAAHRIVDRAIVVDLDPKPRTQRIEAEELKDAEGTHAERNLRVLFTNAEIGRPVEIPKDGEYEVRVQAGGDQAGNEPVRMAIRIDGREVKQFEVKNDREKLQAYAFRGAAKAGRHRVAVAFLNDFWNAQAPQNAPQDRNLVVDWIEVVGPLRSGPVELPESHRRLLASRPGPDKPKLQAARENLARFLPRAFRRPVGVDETERFLKLFVAADAQGDTFEAAMKAPITAVLVSPHFLFRAEPERKGDAPDGPRPLGDYELASRLSYFLWSSMPDDALLEAARQGELRDPAGLERQARRMLQDPKSRALAENFAVQWLQIGRLETAAPDPKKFPQFDAELRGAMRREAVLFFDAIAREDRSVVDLLSVDFTFLNERLARHYGIEGVKGPEMRRVPLADPRRGGVLMMGAVLTATSNPNRTNPSKRGKWVLETLLGKPPPPPLPDAPDLPETPREKGVLSLRQRLERHRSDPRCASCHQRMDPIGFGLENFDAVGAWRDADEGIAVDASATLPDGQSFNGPIDLRAVLLGGKDDFIRAFTEKLLTYALGRGVEFEDAGTVEAVHRALAADGYRFSLLVAEIVKSAPFRLRGARTEPPAEGKARR